MHLSKEQRKQRADARIAGRTAFKNKLTLADNPYEAGTDFHSQWDTGWQESEHLKRLNDEIDYFTRTL